MVEGPSDRFLDALDRWVEVDDPDTREDLEMAAHALVAIWRDAAVMYQATEGEPTEEVPVHA
jgi:hypothetical protein